MKPTSRPVPPELRDELERVSGGQELIQVWDLLALADPVAGSSEAAETWQRISAEIADRKSVREPDAGAASQESRTVSLPGSMLKRKPRIWQNRTAMSAAAALVVFVAATAWFSVPVTVSAPAGEIHTVLLPDGSSLELNAGSSIEYARGFRRAGLLNGPRTVKLEGEAYFDVVSSERPFTVLTADARVTVLGTQFLVRSHASDESGTRVTVESGRVRVQPEGMDSDAGIELGAGEGAVVRRGSVPVVNTGVAGLERLTLWRKGGLAFVDMPLKVIFRELERRYAVEIRLLDEISGDEHLAVYYSERPSIETVLNDLCTSAGLRYRRTSRGFEITAMPESTLPAP